MLVDEGKRGLQVRRGKRSRRPLLCPRHSSGHQYLYVRACNCQASVAVIMNENRWDSTDVDLVSLEERGLVSPGRQQPRMTTSSY